MLGFFGILLVAAAVAVFAATWAASGLRRLGFPLPTSDRRIGCVDGLRGYLALSVMVYHFFLWLQSTRLGGVWSSPKINVINELGAGGVALFFMTTGLVFYPRILAGLSATSWPAVYVTRIFRILPLVAASIGIVTGLIILRTGRGIDAAYIGSFAQWLSSWGEPDLLGYSDTARVNAYVLWSLTFEWAFYFLLLPACALAMDVVRRFGLPTWTVPVLLLVGSVGGRISLALRHEEIDSLKYVPVFAVGMLAFEFQRRSKFVETLTTPAATTGALIALMFGMTVARFPYDLALPFFGIFFITVACGNNIWGILTTRGALVLGECSFGLYLLHGIVLDILFTDAKNFTDELATFELVTLLPVAMVAAVLAAACVHLLVERPMIRSGRWLTRGFAGRRMRLTGSEREVAP